MPPGTVYLQASEPWAWSDIRVKHSTISQAMPGDWIDMNISDIECDGSAQLMDRWADMLDSGVTYPLDLETTGRDGLFDAGAIFMIYERDDLLKLAEMFTKLASADQG